MIIAFVHQVTLVGVDSSRVATKVGKQCLMVNILQMVSMTLLRSTNLEERDSVGLMDPAMYPAKSLCLGQTPALTVSWGYLD